MLENKSIFHEGEKHLLEVKFDFYFMIDDTKLEAFRSQLIMLTFPT